MSPDNYVQDPYNTQNFNRFGYMLNNPLLYTDPSGEIAQVVVAMLIGAAIGVLTTAISNISNGIPFWHDTGKAAVIGAVSGAISFGIGNAATSSFTSAWSQAAFQAGMHGIKGGIMSAIEGGDFGSGFLAGAVSSMVSSGIEALGNGGKEFCINDSGKEVLDSTFGSRNSTLLKAIMITSGGLSGGLSSAIAGGSFWKGVREGLITSGLNHAMSHIAEDITKKNKISQVLEDLGVEGKPEVSYKSIEKLLEHPEMMKAYKMGGSPELRKQLEVHSKNNDSRDYGTCHMVTGKIDIYERAFFSWEDLGLTFVHKLRHRFHAVGGNMTNWTKKYGFDAAMEISEYYARQYQYNVWDNALYPGIFSGPKNNFISIYGKEIKFKESKYD